MVAVYHRAMNASLRRAIFERLRAANPHPTTELRYRTPFELLVAVILSAQATDVSVNLATTSLFPLADTPEKLLALGEAGLILHIRRIGLFGSTIRGDARPDSDVDILLEFAEGRKTFDAFMDVADLLETSFPVHVDVLTPESFDPLRRARIEREAVYYEIGA